MADDCLFCKIVSGEVPADIVRSDEHTVSFRDINPQAPTHVLVITRQHLADVVELAGEPALAGAFLAAVRDTAAELGVTSGFRTVFNTGADAHQTVFHVHAHVLGGRSLGWPPG
jgi:histidine triad (HIT) family protein